MAFPKTLVELKTANYIFVRLDVCRGCRRVIEWWETPKKPDGTGGRMMPLDPTDGGQVVTHFATCPKAADFRKRGAAR